MISKRDGLIELLRFLATCGIAIFHFEWIYLGQPIYFQHFYIWVEFFFVLSGFFLVKNALENQNANDLAPIIYTIKQGIKLWKPYLPAFIFSLIAYYLTHEMGGGKYSVSTVDRKMGTFIFTFNRDCFHCIPKWRHGIHSITISIQPYYILHG